MAESGKLWEKMGKIMAMFFGEFDYKIDDKGRVPLPPKFRSSLKDGVILTPGVEKCITAYPLSEWKKLAATLTSDQLTQSPNGWIYGCYKSNFTDGKPHPCQNQGQKAPDHAIIEVVNKSCLGDRSQIPVLPGGFPKDVLQLPAGMSC